MQCTRCDAPVYDAHHRWGQKIAERGILGVKMEIEQVCYSCDDADEHSPFQKTLLQSLSNVSEADRKFH